MRQRHINSTAQRSLWLARLFRRHNGAYCGALATMATVADVVRIESSDSYDMIKKKGPSQPSRVSVSS